MYQKVKAYVQKEHMLEKTDKVVAGISGGADSICLLFVLLRLQREIPFTLTAVHVHHGIRGASADADEAYVRRVCKEQKVALTVFHRDVRAYAREHGLTEEEGGREVRRLVLEEERKRLGGTCIALAHHRNDNAETLLWNLCRGTGLAGLGAIVPKNGAWIRPLLCVGREEIESYLGEMGISYCTDETNVEDAYTRNRIRNHVIPYLEKHINEGTVLHMAETIEQMQSLGRFVDEEVDRYGKLCVKEENGETVLKAAAFQSIPEALKPYVIRRILCEAAGQSKDLEKVHIEIVQELLEKQVGKQVNLPYGVLAVRCYEGISFRKDSKEELCARTRGPKADAEGIYISRVFEASAEQGTFPQNPYTKWFDYDIIKNTVKIRHKEPGDYITINRTGGTQKLKQYFVNEKIPREQREAVWLVADGAHIMWIIGYRQNQAYQVTKATRRILEIEFCGGEKDGRDSESNDIGRRSSKED